MIFQTFLAVTGIAVAAAGSNLRLNTATARAAASMTPNHRSLCALTAIDKAFFEDNNAVHCGKSYLFTDVFIPAKDAAGCTDSAQVVLRTLSNTTTNSAAKTWLMEQCQNSGFLPPSCIDNIPQVLEAADHCSANHLWSLVGAQKCAWFSALQEIQIHNPAVVDNASAKAWLVEICQGQFIPEPCIPEGTLETVFETIGECKADRLVSAVFVAKNEAGCFHTSAEEVVLYAKTYHGDIAAAAATENFKTWLIELCEANIVRTKCTSGIDALDFVNIVSCSTSSILSKAMALVSTDEQCTHSKKWETIMIAKDSLLDLPETLDSLSTALNHLRVECFKVAGCTLGGDMTLNINGCTYDTVKTKIENRLARANDCPNTIDQELIILTNTDTIADAEASITAICKAAWGSLTATTYADIDTRFQPDFMNQYAAGDTFLNTETGNFIGQNTDYPTSAQSRSAGESIASFYASDAGVGAQNSYLEGFSHLENCENQAIMCCFGRDRQSNDGNGNCNDGAGNCGPDADPGDNSNLCYTSQDHPYPVDYEDDVHCHGLAWADDVDSLEFKFRFNNFFYISMYDHMYTRGYVEPTVRNGDPVAMCNCVEKMPPVTRSDCTEIAPAANSFSLDRAPGGVLQAIHSSSGDVIDFNACKGVDRNNDLSEYVERLVSEGRFSTTMRDNIQKVLVGHATPKNNNREDVCEASYTEAFNVPYPV